MSVSHECRLANLLNLSAEQWKVIEQTRLDDKLGMGWQSRLVVFGAGPLGRRVVAGLRAEGIEPLAFVDNRQELQGSTIDGLCVSSPQDLISEMSVNLSFVVAAWRYQAILKQLRELGVGSSVTFKTLFWRFPKRYLPFMRLDLPHRIAMRTDALERTLALFLDDRSKSEFVNQIEWLLDPGFPVLPINNGGEQYFESELFLPDAEEVFVDCGAYTGDTLIAFMRHWPSFRLIHALEPEASNIRGFEKWLRSISPELSQKVILHPYAASDRRGTLRFHSDGVGSCVDLSGDLEVEAITLDELFADRPVTFIKMDIEGAEVNALSGARNVIMRDQPIIAACLYHCQQHLWEIPLLLRELRSDYRYFLRRYGDEFGDVVCYAVPPHRCIA